MFPNGMLKISSLLKIIIENIIILSPFSDTVADLMSADDVEMFTNNLMVSIKQV